MRFFFLLIYVNNNNNFFIYDLFMNFVRRSCIIQINLEKYTFVYCCVVKC